MNGYRDEWMEQLLAREMRMVDAQVTAALQNGTAFFASTSLIAIGGTLTLLRSTDEILTMVSLLPFGATSSRDLVGDEDAGARRHLRLCVLQIRLVVPAVQLFRHHGRRGAAAGGEGHARRAQAFAHRAARLCADAGRHFNRGQRAFFFALGYLGWFLGPMPLALTTTGIVIVMWRRQFASESRKAFETDMAAPKPARAETSLGHSHQDRDQRHDQHGDAAGETVTHAARSTCAGIRYLGSRRAQPGR